MSVPSQGTRLFYGAVTYVILWRGPPLEVCGWHLPHLSTFFFHFLWPWDTYPDMVDQSQPPPQFHGSRQLNAYVCLFITFAAATVTLVLRLVSSRLTKVSLWFDDYLAILAYACAIVWCGLV